MTTSLEDRLRNDLTAAAAGVRVAPAPPFDQLSPARGRRSRRTLVGGLAAGLTLVALPAAAATGALSSVTEAFGWSHQPGVIEAADATGQLLLTMTGPGGEPMQLYSAASVDGGRCLSLLLPQETGQARLADAECTSGEGLRETASMPLNADFTEAAHGGGFMVIIAPAAARLVLTVGGVQRDLPLADGASGLYLTAAEEGKDPTLHSYDAAGHPTGKLSVAVPSPTP